MTKLIVAFRNFANAPKIHFLPCRKHCVSITKQQQIRLCKERRALSATASWLLHTVVAVIQGIQMEMCVKYDGLRRPVRSSSWSDALQDSRSLPWKCTQRPPDCYCRQRNVLAVLPSHCFEQVPASAVVLVDSSCCSVSNGPQVQLV